MLSLELGKGEGLNMTLKNFSGKNIAVLTCKNIGKANDKMLCFYCYMTKLIEQLK